jgi:TolB-like protein/class 3 adenylate cyclase
VERRLAAVLAADVAGYSRLMGADEEGTLARLKAVRKSLVDPTIAAHRGRIVKTTGDGMLVEFASAVDAVRGAVEVQRRMADQNVSVPQDQRIEFRIGIHVGDIIIDDNDIFGDGVNIAARLEGIAESGGVCISDDAQRQIRGKIDIGFDDFGLQTLKNIAEPMRAWRVQLGGPNAAKGQPGSLAPQVSTLALPDKPSIAVLPFQNMSGDPEQEYFADGMVEDIITALSRFKSLFVIARNSSFTYKGNAVDIKQVGRELGVRYVLEGSVRKAGGKIRITGQLIDALAGTHLWADRFDGGLDDIFDLQDKITEQVIGALMPTMRRAEIERLKLKRTESLGGYDYFIRALSHYNQRSTTDAFKTEIDLCYSAINADPNFAGAYSLAAVFFVLRNNFRMMIDRGAEVTEGLRLARHAIEIGKDDPENLARAGLAIGNLGDDTERPRGLALLDEAADLNPNLVDAWNSSGWGQIFFGSLERGRDNLLRAAIEPFGPPERQYAFRSWNGIFSFGRR